MRRAAEVHRLPAVRLGGGDVAGVVVDEDRLRSAQGKALVGFSEASFEQSTFSRVRFDGCRFNGVSLRDVHIESALYDGMTIDGILVNELLEVFRRSRSAGTLEG